MRGGAPVGRRVQSEGSETLVALAWRWRGSPPTAILLCVHDGSSRAPSS